MDVCSLGYVWIESTDPSQWKSFATDVIGMMVATAMPDDGNVYLKMDDRPYRFAIYQGSTNRLALCGWELRDKADFEKTCNDLTTLGVCFQRATQEQCKLRCVKDCICLKDPSGHCIELYWGGSLDYVKFNSPVGVSGFETGFNGSMGLGHVVLSVSKLAETHRFYQNVLGFCDTDYMHFKFSNNEEDQGQGLHFMHVNNPRHHSLALYEDQKSTLGCAHIMVEAYTIDDVGYCLDRVKEHGCNIVFSLGRHANDKMLSFYVQTPAGFPLEFGCGGLQLDWKNFTPTISTLPSIWGHKLS